MSEFRRFLLIAVCVVGAAFVVQPARAAGLPADLCSLLPASDVSKTLGQPYDAPQESVAPPPFAKTNTGTDCNYQSKGASAGKLWFRVYVDPSPSAATDLFARLKAFYSPPTAVPHLGNEAYFDPEHALHVRKGKVRFYLNLTFTGNFGPTQETQIENLAKQVIKNL